MVSKSGYLKELTSKLTFRTKPIGQKLEGSSPPSVFIGRAGYPKVFIGPMMVQEHGDTHLLDSPEEWIPGNKSVEDIIGFRMDLVRGTSLVGIHDLNNKLVNTLQEITLSKRSLDANAFFSSIPQGRSFDEESQPFGPSASIKHFELNENNVSYNHYLQKAHYDTDFKAQDAMIYLYKQGLSFTQIQKALSVGTLGIEKNRKLVPTRWSITALDDTLGLHLLDNVKDQEILDTYLVYEFESLKNRFVVLFVPRPFQYEFMELFIHVLGDEEYIFSDYELNRGRTTYASIGGCYYAVRFAAAEKLFYMKKQASVIVFREAYPGYVPLGVFNCRETARHAFMQKPLEFHDLKSATIHVKSRLMRYETFVKQSVMLKEIREQNTLVHFF